MSCITQNKWDTGLLSAKGIILGTFFWECDLNNWKGIDSVCSSKLNINKQFHFSLILVQYTFQSYYFSEDGQCIQLVQKLNPPFLCNPAEQQHKQQTIPLNRHEIFAILLAIMSRFFRLSVSL